MGSGGTAVIDECGVCDGDNTCECLDDDSLVSPVGCAVAIDLYGCDGMWGDQLISEACPVSCDACPDIEIEGCMDSTANNYNPDATIDDGTCEYDDCVEVFNEGYELGAQSGDVNLDGLSNVLDIVTLANCILSGECQ